MAVIGLAFVAAVVLSSVLPAGATGSDPNGGWVAVGPLDAADELNKRSCENLAKNPKLVDVTQAITNDDDSGVGGNAWAHDDYTRNIKVFKTTTQNVYCVVLNYDGVFETYAGASPQNTGVIPAGIQGTMRGGYRAIVTGVFNPTQPTSGFIGNFDYQCDGSFNCPGYVSWTTFYFDQPTSGFDYQWWGWKYSTDDVGHKSRWINACTGPDLDCPGNAGDIL